MKDFFHLAENKTTCVRELTAGGVTFAAMSYILCIQPALLSGEMLGTETGMSFSALVTTTCLASAFGSILMGLAANYPFALAPGMGENFFLVVSLFPVCAAVLGGRVGDANVWQLAMGVLFCAGALFFLLSLFRVRELLLDLVSDSMKSAIAVGIGLFIAFLGLQGAGLVTVNDGQLVMGNLFSRDVGVFLIGLVIAMTLMARRVPGGIFIGMLAAGLVAFFIGKIRFLGVCSLPPSPLSVIGKADIAGVWKLLPQLWPSILILTFMDMFDTFGTAVGIGRQAGFMKGENYPRIERVFMADASASMAGSLMGHSTVTCFIESAAGVASGGRTGLTAITVGVLFLLSMFFTPVVTAFGGYRPITASALVLVGVMMMQQVRQIDWSDLSEAIPSFSVIAGMAFTQSIANGILFGLIAWPFAKLICGKARETRFGNWPLAALLILYLVVTAK